MPLSIAPKIITFTGSEYSQQPRSRKEQVETAATVTGGVGAGVAAVKNGAEAAKNGADAVKNGSDAIRNGALKFFKLKSSKVNTITKTATHAAQAVEQPAKQTRSLLNAFKINGKSFPKQIAEWAEASNMPKFMKGIFTGQLGKAIGKGAAVFVFISGIGEVFSTLLHNVDKAGMKIIETSSSNPY